MSKRRELNSEKGGHVTANFGAVKDNNPGPNRPQGGEKGKAHIVAQRRLNNG